MDIQGIIGTQVTVNASDGRLFFATAAVVIPLIFGYLFVTNRELLTPSGTPRKGKEEAFDRRRQYVVVTIATILAGTLSLGETFCFAQILATPTVLGLRAVAITMCALFGLTAGGALLRWIDRSKVALAFGKNQSKVANAFAAGAGGVCATVLAGPGILLSLNIVSVVGR